MIGANRHAALMADLTILREEAARAGRASRGIEAEFERARAGLIPGAAALAERFRAAHRLHVEALDAICEIERELAPYEFEELAA